MLSAEAMGDRIVQAKFCCGARRLRHFSCETSNAFLNRTVLSEVVLFNQFFALWNRPDIPENPANQANSLIPIFWFELNDIKINPCTNPSNKVD